MKVEGCIEQNPDPVTKGKVFWGSNQKAVVFAAQ
jgi:hypothetical protein